MGRFSSKYEQNRRTPWLNESLAILRKNPCCVIRGGSAASSRGTDVPPATDQQTYDSGKEQPALVDGRDTRNRRGGLQRYIPCLQRNGQDRKGPRQHSRIDSRAFTS